jgi:hypothetical protein
MGRRQIVIEACNVATSSEIGLNDFGLNDFGLNDFGLKG